MNINLDFSWNTISYNFSAMQIIAFKFKYIPSSKNDKMKSHWPSTISGMGPQIQTKILKMKLNGYLVINLSNIPSMMTFFECLELIGILQCPTN